MNLEMALRPPVALASRATVARLDLSAVADDEIVARARGGEAAAAEELAGRCRRPAYLLALQMLGDPDDALDAAQDSLLALLRNLDRFTLGRPLKPWLAAIVRNRCRDLIRQRSRARLESLEPDDDDRPRRELIDTAPGPEADAHRRELQRRMWQALCGLTPSHREILVLRDYQDLTYEEIADVLEVPIGTVMSRLHRARRALGETLGAGWAAEAPE